MAPLKRRSLTELEKEAEVKLPQNLKLDLCLDKMYKLLLTSKRAISSDEKEEAFIYLHRFFMILTKAKEYPEFTKRKYQRLYDSASSKMKEYESLRTILSERYNEKENSEQNSKTSALPTHPYPQEKSLKDLTNTKTAGKDKKNSISTEDVFKMFNSNFNTKESYIIIDARSSNDFKASSLKAPDVINIPEELITHGISAGVITTLLTEPEVKKQWEKRTSVDKLIILDWNSTENKLGPKLRYLREAMVKWDVYNKYKCLPLILEGGYEDILHKYPHITTNSKVLKTFTQGLHIPSLDFDYPVEALEPEIKKNPTPSPDPVTKPVVNGIVRIDRSTKPPIKIEQIDNRFAESESSEVNISDDEKTSKVSMAIDDKLEVQSEEKEDEPPVTKKEDIVHAAKDQAPSLIPDKPSDPKDMLNQLRKVKPDIPITKTPSSNKDGNKGAETTRKVPDKDHSVKRTPEKKSTNGVTRIPLKKEDGPSGGGILKRSSSSPNIAQMTDEVKAPSFTRANKPNYAEKTDSTYGETARGLTGLKNFANNCYMNSILQCLSNTKPLVSKLISLKDFPINYQSKTKGKVAHEVITAFRNMWSGDVKVYSIKDLKNILGGLKEIFKGTGHQDSNEFLIILLEYLHDDLNMPNTVESRLDGAREETGEKAWGEFLRKNCSIIQQLFYGQHRSTVTCSTCHHSSATFEQFFNLYVPIPSKDTCDLTDCLKLYMSGEKISGWKCPKCKDERNATKKFDISRLPPILVIALKRFTNEEDSWLQKKENLVTYPLEGLDMERFTIEGSEQRHTRYNLYAMSTHTGTLRAGHYKAICKNYMSDKWFMFDDQSVDPLPAHSVRNIPEVYILFYCAVNPNC